jgi:predicted TIM-barrel fold metal-dependent hydrolase
MMPIQIHVGFGDRDQDLHRVNPMLLLGLLRVCASSSPGSAKGPE